MPAMPVQSIQNKPSERRLPSTSLPMERKTLKAKKKKSLSSRIRRLLTTGKRKQKNVSIQYIESLNCKKCGDVDCEQYVALDCEMVGVGPMAKESALARCTVVDYHGKCLCDLYVKPDVPVTDYRTPWSGIRKEHIQRGLPFFQVQNHVQQLIDGKILIGHALHNDLQALHLRHPFEQIADTSKCVHLRRLVGMETSTPISLKRLSKQLLHRTIQQGEHCSLEDARAAMDLFKISKNKNTDVHLKSFMTDDFWPSDFDNE